MTSHSSFPYTTNAALSGQKLWVIMCSEAKRNSLFLFRLNALLYAIYLMLIFMFGRIDTSICIPNELMKRSLSVPLISF